MLTARLCAVACAGALAVAGAAVPAPVPPGAKETPASERARLTGTWVLVSRQISGAEAVAPQPNERRQYTSFSAEGAVTWSPNDMEFGKVVRVDPAKSPKEIDYTISVGGHKGKTQKGIYKFEGDTFTDCCALPGDDRPAEFKSTAENRYEIMVFKKVTKNE